MIIIPQIKYGVCHRLGTREQVKTRCILTGSQGDQEASPTNGTDLKRERQALLICHQYREQSFLLLFNLSLPLFKGQQKLFL